MVFSVQSSVPLMYLNGIKAERSRKIEFCIVACSHILYPGPLFTECKSMFLFEAFVRLLWSQPG